MKQIAVALHNYQIANGRFPYITVMPLGQTYQPWSAHARLLPYLEEAGLATLIDWKQSPEFTGKPIASKTRVSTYLCPNDRERPTPTLTHYPLNYVFNQGTWFIYDPVKGEVGDAAFMPNRAFKPGDFTDSLSRTLAASEATTYQPNIWDTGLPNALGISPPATPADLAPFFGGTFEDRDAARLYSQTQGSPFPAAMQLRIRGSKPT